MAGLKLSSKAQKAMDTLQLVRRKVERVHSLTEQYCSAKSAQDSMAQSLSRAAADVGRLLMNNGLGVMADSANQVAMGAKRGGHTQAKYRQLRELVGGLRVAIDRAEKNVLDAERQHEHDEAGH
jgi:nitrate/nitrite-specific signal transduction histidine kinase